MDLTLVDRVRAVLTPDLLKLEYRGAAGKPASWGHCYAASEAIFWIEGGFDAGHSMMQVRHEGVSHWFVRLANGWIIDPTSDQFKTLVPYEKGRANNGFVRQHGVSERAEEIIRRLG